jgi:hypothetical protein
MYSSNLVANITPGKVEINDRTFHSCKAFNFSTGNVNVNFWNNKLPGFLVLLVSKIKHRTII